MPLARRPAARNGEGAGWLPNYSRTFRPPIVHNSGASRPVENRLEQKITEDGPDLHFAINDGPNPLTSDSLPFEIDRFRFQGNSADGPRPGQLTLTGRPHDVRRSHPLVRSVSDYSR
jgi:hypothetical protein